MPVIEIILQENYVLYLFPKKNTTSIFFFFFFCGEKEFYKLDEYDSNSNNWNKCWKSDKKFFKKKKKTWYVYDFVFVESWERRGASTNHSHLALFRYIYL